MLTPCLNLTQRLLPGWLAVLLVVGPVLPARLCCCAVGAAESLNGSFAWLTTSARLSRRDSRESAGRACCRKGSPAKASCCRHTEPASHGKHPDHDDTCCLPNSPLTSDDSQQVPCECCLDKLPEVKPGVRSASGNPEQTTAFDADLLCPYPTASAPTAVLGWIRDPAPPLAHNRLQARLCVWRN